MPPDLQHHPYSALTPDVVLDALASVGLCGDGRLTALSSYENRVYQVGLETDPVAGADHPASVVAKFYRPNRWSDAQILEEHAFAAELMAAEIPMVGPLVLEGATLHRFGGFAFSVSPRRGGRAPELDDFEVLEWTGRFIARIHNVGAARPFNGRPALDLPSFGSESRDWLINHDCVPLDVRADWLKACNVALEIIAINDQYTRALGTFIAENAPKAVSSGQNPSETPPPVQILRLHGDCHPGNILWTPAGESGEGPHFVDLDDCRSGPAVQDLWMLLSGERADRTAQLSGLLDGYEQLRPFDRRELVLIEPLRTLRLIHYSAWLARRFADPTFPIHFPWFGTSDYWKDQTVLLREQCEVMQQDPLML